MSTDYYNVCKTCKRYAHAYRRTAGGVNPPDSKLASIFFFDHCMCPDFHPAEHEQSAIMLEVCANYDHNDDCFTNGWAEVDVWRKYPPNYDELLSGWVEIAISLELKENDNDNSI